MGTTAGFDLLNNAIATGNAFLWPGGQGVFSAAGTFNGATVKLQFLGADNVTWVDAGAATTLTVAGAGVFILPPCRIRAAVTGGPPASMFANVGRVPV